ncbi:hypothetical protein HNY73_013996 [Argiope bruennichi]|uniref:Uncharacterized protein n=1 Tax=Argiope bruennichi TaxID=94029 RepID=A0A8T0ENX6_ARGBR|nr:hypothetical protein HNY73_013996 [Argiope bruennichi]
MRIHLLSDYTLKWDSFVKSALFHSSRTHVRCSCAHLLLTARWAIVNETQIIVRNKVAFKARFLLTVNVTYQSCVVAGVQHGPDLRRTHPISKTYSIVWKSRLEKLLTLELQRIVFDPPLND